MWGHFPRKVCECVHRLTWSSLVPRHLFRPPGLLPPHLPHPPRPLRTVRGARSRPCLPRRTRRRRPSRCGFCGHGLCRARATVTRSRRTTRTWKRTRTTILGLSHGEAEAVAPAAVRGAEDRPIAVDRMAEVRRGLRQARHRPQHRPPRLLIRASPAPSPCEATHSGRSSSAGQTSRRWASAPPGVSPLETASSSSPSTASSTSSADRCPLAARRPHPPQVRPLLGTLRVQPSLPRPPQRSPSRLLPHTRCGRRLRRQLRPLLRQRPSSSRALRPASLHNQWSQHLLPLSGLPLWSSSRPPQPSWTWHRRLTLPRLRSGLPTRP